MYSTLLESMKVLGIGIVPPLSHNVILTNWLEISFALQGLRANEHDKWKSCPVQSGRYFGAYWRRGVNTRDARCSGTKNDASGWEDGRNGRTEACWHCLAVNRQRKKKMKRTPNLLIFFSRGAILRRLFFRTPVSVPIGEIGFHEESQAAFPEIGNTCRRRGVSSSTVGGNRHVVVAYQIQAFMPLGGN
jgi:hypothetical protein